MLPTHKTPSTTYATEFSKSLSLQIATIPISLGTTQRKSGALPHESTSQVTSAWTRGVGRISDMQINWARSPRTDRIPEESYRGTNPSRFKLSCYKQNQLLDAPRRMKTQSIQSRRTYSTEKQPRRQIDQFTMDYTQSKPEPTTFQQVKLSSMLQKPGLAKNQIFVPFSLEMDSVLCKSSQRSTGKDKPVVSV